MDKQRAFDGMQRSIAKRWGRAIEEGVRSCKLRPLDQVRNWRFVRSDRRIALVRDRHGYAKYYNSFLRWIADRFPEVRSRLEFMSLPCRIHDWSRYALVVPWISETLLCGSTRVRQQTLALQSLADAHDVPMINRPDRLLSISKHDTAQRISQLGVRTPRIEHITDRSGFSRHFNGMQLPLLVREDLAHGGRSPVFLVRHPRDASQIPLQQFARPIAVEFVDVRSPRDGLIRKYRYMAVGDTGIAHTLQISDRWEVRADVRVINDATRAEEIVYADAADPHHELFQRVRRGLGLDSVAFDYSLDHEGQVIIWEINVLPGLAIPTKPHREHLIPPIERAMAATVRLLLQRARMDVPPQVEELIEIQPRTTSPSAVNHAALVTGGAERARELTSRRLTC